MATVQRAAPTWDKEAEEMLRRESPLAMKFAVTDEMLAKHAGDVEFIRRQLDMVKSDLDQLEATTAKLESIVDRFSNSEHLDAALAAFQAWTDACGRKAALRRQMLDLRKAWSDASGLASAAEVALAADKARETGLAKLDVARARTAAGERGELVDVTPKLGGGAFERP